MEGYQIASAMYSDAAGERDARENPSALHMARIFARAIQYTWSYPHSPGKRYLWIAFFNTVCDLPQYRLRGKFLGYLSSHTVCLRCMFGVVVLTEAELQINVAFAIPRMPEMMTDLLALAFRYLRTTYPDRALNFEFVQKREAKDCILKCDPCRRFVASADHIDLIRLDLEARSLFLHGRTTPVLDVIQPRDIASFVPLRRLRYEDADDAVYWHRFPCGTLVTMHNPFIPLVAPISPPPPVDCVATLLPEIDSKVGAFLAALRPASIYDSALVLADENVPSEFRQLVVRIACSCLGMSDELLNIVFQSFRRDEDSCELVSRMVHMGAIVAISHQLEAVRQDDMRDVAANMLRILSLVPNCEYVRWHRWMVTSPFAYAWMATFPNELAAHLCARSSILRDVMVHYLASRIGAWSAADSLNASMLMRLRADGRSTAPSSDVARELARVREEHIREVGSLDELAGTSGAPEASPARRGAPRHRRRAARERRAAGAARASEAPGGAEPDAAAPAEAAPARTHHGLASRIQAWLGLPCTLIGSGIFSDESDADIVIEVRDAASLDEAYDLVLARSGWRRLYTRLSGEHVAVIGGAFEGVRVDAQVWRGTATCRAERESERAVALARRLEDEADEAMRVHVRLLHTVMSAASLKSHRMCRLPGVAVTSLALVLSCRGNAAGSESLVRMLRALRALLDTTAPYADLDTMTASNDERVRERPITPLSVLVDGANVTTRLTTCTTRHVLDAVAHALSRPPADGGDLNRGLFRAWRRAHMVVCARVRPRNGDSSVASALHLSLASLDGHPMLDAIFVEEEEEEQRDGAGGVLVVYATLSGGAEARRYALQPEHRIEQRGLHHVTVANSGRSWPLARSEGNRRPPRERHESADVCDPIRVRFADGTCAIVPNAPHLTVDVLSRFDERAWEWVVD